LSRSAGGARDFEWSATIVAAAERRDVIRVMQVCEIKRPTLKA
jgi:hypothetical protein